jgi:hypothetical protein
MARAKRHGDAFLWDQTNHIPKSASFCMKTGILRMNTITIDSSIPKKIKNPEVAAVFKSYPQNVRTKLLFLRRLILETAASTKGVGEIEETLK